ncbi:unnamed protein product [Paramecium octaurelia]|uniref:Uncharacterized protein n=1 Tax=Paramecium octaurelia TaxID=43137 RepID=A0A8S1VBM9_PAROT|nr:unnamed protein product [Paramecium octaurelia]
MLQLLKLKCYTYGFTFRNICQNSLYYRCVRRYQSILMIASQRNYIINAKMISWRKSYTIPEIHQQKQMNDCIQQQQILDVIELF